MNPSRHCLSLLAFLWLASATGRPAVADPYAAPGLHPNLARGLSNTQKFDGHQETVQNLFNGNLIYSVDLGGEYPVDARLAYKFRLLYNSHIWDFEATTGHSEPVGASNAGVGFDLSFGRLLPPQTGANGTSQWMFIDPTGRQQLFYSSLHADTPDTNDPFDNVQYTRDSTYLRLLHQGSQKKVESPDGTFRVFATVNGEWRIVSLGSQISSLTVSFTYAADDSAWTVSDSHGRSHTIRFLADATGAYGKLVDEVEVAASAGRTAVYSLAYQTLNVPRACSDPRGGSVSVPVLSSVTNPLGQVRAFSYFGAPDTCTKAGRLRQAQMKTGGHYRWDYADYPFPALDCQGATPAYLSSVPGVTTREKVWENGNVFGRWSFSPAATTAADGCGFSARTTTVQTPIGDKTTFHFRVGTDSPSSGAPAFYGMPVGGSSQPSFGFGTGPVLNTGLSLSREIFDCNSAGGACQLLRSVYEDWTQDTRCGSTSSNCFDTQPRATRHKTVFHDDPTDSGAQRYKTVTYSQFDGLGKFRQKLTLSNFGEADQLTEYESFNPDVGNYTPGNPWTAPASSRVWKLDTFSLRTRQDDHGSKTFLDACHDSQGRLVTTRRRGAQPSAHDLVSQNLWLEGQTVERRLFGGDTQTLSASADLCSLSLPSTPSFIRRETFSHGTRAKVEYVDPLGQEPTYVTKDRDIDPNTGLIAIERDVSGLATTLEYDLLGRETWKKPEAGQGAWTQHVYSAPIPRSDGWGGPRHQMMRLPNGSPNGPHLAYRLEISDPFGNPFLDLSRSQPNVNTNDVRKTFFYNAMGQKTRESNSYSNGEALHWTWFQDHDPFDRWRKKVPPEGASHQVTRQFKGARADIITEQGEKAFQYEVCYLHPVIGTIERDGQGRVWKHETVKAQPLPGSRVLVENLYDVDGDLLTTDHKQESANQVRTWTRTTHTFDARGLKTSQSYEAGVTSLRLIESIEHSSFNALGSPTGMLRSGDEYRAGGLATGLHYDSASRLVKIVDGVDPSKVWKEMVFATDNGPADASGRIDARKGKLVEAVRHNYMLNNQGHHTVTERNIFRGVGGLKSEMTTELETIYASSTNYRIDKTYRTTASYDELGRRIQETYPVCISDCSTHEPTTVRTLHRAYDDLNRLTSLTGTWGTETDDWLDSVTWHASGIPARMDHDNGVSDIYAADPYGYSRPGSIEVVGSPQITFHTDDLIYDGRNELCGLEYNVSSVLAPDEGSLGFAEIIPCVDAQLKDPFGRWNGQFEDQGCKPIYQTLDPIQIFDARDRHFATFDLSLREMVLVNDEWVSLPDPDEFVYRYTLFGIGQDRALRQVEDHYLGEWRQLKDKIYGVEGVLVGQAELDLLTLYHHRLHKHPRDAGYTDWRGWKANP